MIELRLTLFHEPFDALMVMKKSRVRVGFLDLRPLGPGYDRLLGFSSLALVAEPDPLDAG